MADERAKAAAIMKDWDKVTTPIKAGKLKLRAAAGN
jgi:hypothetical protein